MQQVGPGVLGRQSEPATTHCRVQVPGPGGDANEGWKEQARPSQASSQVAVAQVQALTDAMPDRCRAMIIIQAGLGLRIGELLALRLARCRLPAPYGAGRVAGHPRRQAPLSPKTPRSRRTVPLPTVVAETLAAHISEFAPAKDGSLFTTTSGNLYRQEHTAHRRPKPVAAKCSS